MSRNIPLGILAAGRKTIIPFTWTQGNTSESNTYYGAAYANLTNAKWFGFGGGLTGSSTTTYTRSTDSLTWSDGTMPSNRIWGKAAANSTRVVVVSKSSSTNGAYTDNGTTWTSTTILGTAAVMQDIIWDGTRFLVVTDSLTEDLAYSTTGASWTRLNVGTSTGLRTIAYDGVSRYIAGQDGSSTYYTTTGDPTNVANWTTGTMPASASWCSYVYGNGIWIAGRSSSTSYATSPDGVTWTTRTLPRTFRSSDARFFFWGDQFHFASGTVADADVKIWSSEDGITWVQRLDQNSSEVYNVNGWAANADTIMGIGFEDSSNGQLQYFRGTR